MAAENILELGADRAGCKAQDLVADLLRPGNTAPEILDALNLFLAERGYDPEERLFSHGQGYDLIAARHNPRRNHETAGKHGPICTSRLFESLCTGFLL